MNIDNLPPEATEDERNRAGRMIALLIRTALLHREMAIHYMNDDDAHHVSKCLGQFAGSLAHEYGTNYDALLNEVKTFAESLGIEVTLEYIGPVTTDLEKMN